MKLIKLALTGATIYYVYTKTGLDDYFKMVFGMKKRKRRKVDELKQVDRTLDEQEAEEVAKIVIDQSKRPSNPFHFKPTGIKPMGIPPIIARP